MERRKFLKTLFGGLAAAAAVRTWPYRVYSFPTEIKEFGLSVRFVRGFDAEVSMLPEVTRFDVLYGFGGLYPGKRFDRIIGAASGFDYIDVPEIKGYIS